jgi:hypothetical protein
LFIEIPLCPPAELVGFFLRLQKYLTIPGCWLTGYSDPVVGTEVGTIAVQ